jgi:hypothetical protein
MEIFISCEETEVKETIKLGSAGITEVVLRAYPDESKNVDLDIYFSGEHFGGVCLNEKARSELVYQIIRLGRIAASSVG